MLMQRVAAWNLREGLCDVKGCLANNAVDIMCCIPMFDFTFNTPNHIANFDSQLTRPGNSVITINIGTVHCDNFLILRLRLG
jgi:hypothetical protein